MRTRFLTGKISISALALAAALAIPFASAQQPAAKPKAPAAKAAAPAQAAAPPAAAPQPVAPPAAAPAAADASGRLLPSTAAAYADYQGEVTGIRAAPIKSADELDSALTTFGAQNSDQLSSGWIAYSAMVAAQDKEFAEAVRDFDAYYKHEGAIDILRNYPNYARSLKGGEHALQTSLAVNSRDTSRISSAAAFVKEQAYKLQDVTWGKARLKDAGGAANRLKVNAKTVRPFSDAAKKFFAAPDLNLALADATSDKPASASIWDRISLITASAPAAAINQISAPVTAATALKVDPRREGTADRIVTLAAFHVIEAENGHRADVTTAMKDKPTYDCIDWSQLQLQACVSAAYTRADLSFCLAEHAIGDAGQCFANVAK